MKMNKTLLAGVAAAAFSVMGPSVRPAYALLGVGDVVVCPTCSSAIEQLASDAKQALQYTAQLQSYVTQLEQYKNEIQNTISIPLEVFEQVQGDLAQLQQLTQAASLLSGNSGSIIQRLNSAGAYADQLSSGVNSIGNIGNQYTMWQQTLGNSAKQLGMTITSSQTAMKSNTSAMSQAEQHSQSAAGTVQAIQAGNEIAAATGATLQQMAQTNVSLAQQISTNQEVAADRRASNDAAMLHFTAPQATPTTGYQGF